MKDRIVEAQLRQVSPQIPSPADQEKVKVSKKVKLYQKSNKRKNEEKTVKSKTNKKSLILLNCSWY